MNKLIKNSPILEIRLFPESLLVFICIALVIYRLFLGVDFSDDAYLIASCAHYLSGGLPFIDEYNMHQGTALLMYPFIKFYHLLCGFNGVLLYTRFMNVFLASFCALFIAYCLRNRLSSYGIFFVALYILIVRPDHAPSFSYNFLAVFFSTMSFFGFYRAIESKSKVIFCASVFFLGLCCINYPPAILIVPYFLFFGKNLFPPKQYSIVIFFLCALSIFIATYCFIHFSSLINDYLNYVNFCHAYQYGDHYNSLLNAKLYLIFYYTLNNKLFLMHLIIIFCSFLFFFFTKTKKWKIFFPLSILFFLLIEAICSFRYGSSPNLYFISYLALLAPVYLLFFNKDEKDLYLLRIVWIPSFIMAFIFSFTSGCGGQNLSMGFYPASIVTLIYYFRACAHKSKIWIFPLYGIIFYSIHWQYADIFRDDHFLRLKVQIESGPYKGLFTTLEKKNYIDEVKKQLMAIENQSGKSKSILFAYSFSAGYLMSDLMPVTPSIWLIPQVPYEFYQSYFNNHNRKKPDFVFLMKKIPYGVMKKIPYGTRWYEPFVSQLMPINSFVEQNKYHKVYESENFDVFSSYFSQD